MARVRFTSPTFFEGVSYAQNQVEDLPQNVIKALGDSVEKADNVDVEEEADKLSDRVLDPDTRRELDIKHEPGDVQDIPDALRDEQANLRQEKEAQTLADADTKKSVDAPKVDKMVKDPTTKK